MDQPLTMSDTDFDLQPFLPKFSTLTVSAIRALSPLTQIMVIADDTMGGSMNQYLGAQPT